MIFFLMNVTIRNVMDMLMYGKHLFICD